MAHLAMHLLEAPDMSGMGLWLFLSVSAVALFVVFIPVVTWIGSRQEEREAFYKAETFRRLAESPTESARAAIEFLREQDRLQRIKSREGMKIGGLVNICVGVGLTIFLRFLLGSGAGSPWLCGLIPLGVGVALLFYAMVLAAPVE